MRLNFVKRHTFWIALIGVLVVLTGVNAARNAKKKNTDTARNSVPRVLLVSAKDFQKNRQFVSANGAVESLEQADLRGQVSAPVSKVYVSIGSNVKAGQALVSLKNADFAAQVSQAQAAVSAAQARLDETVRGARTESVAIAEAAVKTAEDALATTQKQQQTAVQNARSSLLNAGLSALGATTNTSTATLSITGTYNSDQEGDYKINLIPLGSGYALNVTGLETDYRTIDRGVPIPLGTRGLYITFASSGSITSTDTWTVSIPNKQSSTYLTSANAYQSTLAASQSAITAAQNGVENAKNQLNLLLAGASNEQVRAQQAALDQARANLAAAAAQYDKTIIKTPINGTVSAVAVKLGDLVSPGQAVVSVVNKSGLQIKAYISSTDINDISEGADVDINETIKGVVSKLSPSINPTTKSVEITILVSDPEHAGLTVGQNVSAKIHTKNTDGTGDVAYLLPFQAVKIGSGSNAFVYTVDADSKVKEIPVVIGNVVGENVEVKSGLTNDVNLINGVYDISVGQQVSS